MKECLSGKPARSSGAGRWSPRITAALAAPLLVGLSLAIAFATVQDLNAQPPIGAEFQVNTYTSAYQGGRAIGYGQPGVQKDVAFGEGQGFVVVWQDFGDFDEGSVHGQDGDLGGIFGQRFSAGGSLIGSEFQINTVTAGNQANPAVDMNSSGEFVVVWSSFLRVGYSYTWGIHGQRFDSQGDPTGGQFEVSSVASNFGNRGLEVPDVALAEASPFVVTWESLEGEFVNIARDVMARRYDSNGLPLGSAFLVNTDTQRNHGSPRVTMKPGGDFVVAWEEFYSSGFNLGLPPILKIESGILGQQFSADGSRIGAEIQVNSYTTGLHTGPSIGSDATGGFVVSWTDGAVPEYISPYKTEYVGRTGLFGQRFDASGTPIGEDFQVDSIPLPNPRAGEPGFPPNFLFRGSDIAVESTGNFIVSWATPLTFGDDTSYTSIQTRSFGADGQPWGPEIQVNSWTTGPQNRAAVAGRSSDKFVVVWDDAWQNFYGGVDGQDGSLGGTFGQLFGSAQIFTDGFESGDTSVWSNSTP